LAKLNKEHILDIIVKDIRVPVEQDNIKEYIKAIAMKLYMSVNKINIIKILNKALNIDDKKQFYYELSIVVHVPDTFQNSADIPLYIPKSLPTKTLKHLNERPIIIGSGPCGLFTALELIEYGLKPIIFERGKKIEERSLDVQKFINTKILNTESNIQFGEGGAGAYSDGKLFARIKNSPYANKVLDTFIKFGAPPEIGYMAKPHIGTDVLCNIIKNIRKYLLSCGCEINFNSKMTDMVIKDGKIKSIIINREKEYSSSHIYLAIGHSSHDTFELLNKKGVTLIQKPIAVGIRIEHPAEIINKIRYGNLYKNTPYNIGSATYSFTYTDKSKSRGVYTFCACPGGEIVNASSENDMLVLNGMSYSTRSSAFTNSALVVTCHTTDFPSTHPLAGMEFQKSIEQKTFNITGKTWKAPAQNLMDFLSKKVSTKLIENSYKMGLESVDLREVVPSFVSDMLMSACQTWKKESPLFISEHAVLLGTETRTSCPVKITRNEKYESVNTQNLFPIGEGSGYTGGITSSAVDAIKAVEQSLL
jgi:uncharacterized protein